MPKRTRRRDRKRLPRRRRNKRPSTRRGQFRNTTSSVIATGVRAVAAALPFSQVVSPLAELFLKAIGITAAKYESGKPLTGISVYAASGVLGIRYTNLISRTPWVAMDGTMPWAWITTPFRDAKLRSLTISVKAGNPVGSRQGRWCVAFVPRREQSADMADKLALHDFRTVERMAGSVSAPVTVPLTLNFRPKTNDGYICLFNKIEEIFGYMLLVFTDDMRTDFGTFTADDLHPDVTITGQVELRNAPLDSTYKAYSDRMWCPEQTAYVYNTNDNLVYIFGKNTLYARDKMSKDPNTPDITCNMTDGLVKTWSKNKHVTVPNPSPKEDYTEEDYVMFLG